MDSAIKHLRSWGFLYYVGMMMSFFLLYGGGLKTTTYIITALTFVVFIFWMPLLSRTKEVISHVARATLLFLCLVTFVSYLHTSTPNVGIDDLINLFFGVLVYIVAVRVFGSFKKVIWYFRGTTFLALISALYGYYVYIFYAYDRFSGPFIDLYSFSGFFPNAWVDFVILTFPIALYLGFSRSVQLKWDHWLGRITLITLFASLFLSYSRGGVLSFLLAITGLFILFMFLQKGKLDWSKWWRHVVLSIAMIFISIVLVISTNFLRQEQGFTVQSFYQKATLQSDEKLLSLDERQQFFDASLLLMKDHPVFGYGPYAFQYVFPRYQLQMLATSNHPHSLVYKIAVEIGFLALTLFFIFIAIVLAVIRHGLFHYYYKGNWGIILVTTTSVFGSVVHNLIDYNFNFLINSLLVWVFLGILMAMVLPHSKHLAIKNSWHSWLISFVIITGFFIGIHEAYYGYSFKQARSLTTDTQDIAIISQRITYYERAMNLFQNKDAPVRLMKDYLLIEDYEAATAFAEKNIHKYPYYAELWYYWGELLRLQGNKTGAIDKYLHALALDPLNELRYYLGLYRVLDSTDIPEITGWRTKVLSLTQEYVEHLRINAHYTALSENPEAAIELFELFGLPEQADEVRTLRDLEIDKLYFPKKYQQQP